MSPTRARESGAYLGGIGTMLGEIRACSRCGGVHESHQYGLQHHGRECPEVVTEDFAIISLPDGTEEDPLPEPATAHVSAMPLPFGGPVVVARGPEARPHRALDLPWLAPPDLDEVY